MAAPLGRSIACGLFATAAVLLSGCGGPSSDRSAGREPEQQKVPSAPKCSSGNPFECHKHYINPANSKEYERSIATASGAAKTNLKRMQGTPSAYWIDVYQKIRGEGTGTVEGILKDAASKSPPELVVLIWYDLPNRDCDAKASLGQICCSRSSDGTCNYDLVSDCAGGIHEYKTKYVDPFAEVLGEYHEKLPIVIILEPDGLGNLATNLAHPHCGNSGTQAAYKQGAKYAVNQIVSKAPSVHVYLDAAHGGWLGWESNMELFMKMLKELDLPWHKIRGFATNTANYQPLGMQCPWCPDTGYRNGYCLMGKHKEDPCCSDPCALAKQFNSGNNELNYASFLAAAARHKLNFHPHIVIDTGRNGVPDMRESCANWCNPRGAGAGIPSTTETANKSLIDAYFWLKTPGESDGCSATLPSGKACPRFDSMCGSIDALGQNHGEDPAPEAGKWYDFQVKQLAANAQFNASLHHRVPEFRAKLKNMVCPFELLPGMKAEDFNHTSSDGEHPCSAPFTQCGGKGWFGPGCCAGTCVCKAQGPYNSACQPILGRFDCSEPEKKKEEEKQEQKPTPAELQTRVLKAFSLRSALHLRGGEWWPAAAAAAAAATAAWALFGLLAAGRRGAGGVGGAAGADAEARGLYLYEGLCISQEMDAGPAVVEAA